jgi:hypothetical protein
MQQPRLRRKNNDGLRLLVSHPFARKKAKGWGTGDFLKYKLRDEGGDLLGEDEVHGGDATGCVGGEVEGDFVVADVDVGVVVGSFGEEGELVDEVDGGEEVGKL